MNGPPPRRPGLVGFPGGEPLTGAAVGLFRRRLRRARAADRLPCPRGHGGHPQRNAELLGYRPQTNDEELIPAAVDPGITVR